MAISAKDVMELRKQTDCGMMECKKALTQADGDFEKAIEILREQGLAADNKKAGRIAAEGMVYAVSFDNCAVVVEVNAETDFVAKNDKFVDFTKNLSLIHISYGAAQDHAGGRPVRPAAQEGSRQARARDGQAGQVPGRRQEHEGPAEGLSLIHI